MKARAMVLEEPRRLVQRVFEIPEVGSSDAVLRIEACGLCGTDHEQYSGHLPSGFAYIPGHESVGIIEAIGPEASANWKVDAGDRVAVEVFQSCRECEPCREGNYRWCGKHGMADMYGFIATVTEPGLWGGYATHQYLTSDSMLLPVPDNLDPVSATLFNPLGAGIRWGVTVPGTGEGDVVAVLGPGVRGLSSVAAAKEAGASFVMITGLGKRDAPRLEMAKEFGADLVVDVAETSPIEALHEATGQGADVVVDVTAKAPTAFAQAIGLAAPGGTVVVAGTRGTGEAPGFNPDAVVFKEIRILGALGVDYTAYRAALDLLASGKYPFADLPRRVTGFDGIEDLLKTMSGETGEVPPIHGVLVPDDRRQP